MKQYDFDRIIRRENTGSVKFDLRKEFFGTEELMPMWVADMDFATPDFILEAIRERASHEILGYSIRTDGFYDSIMEWLESRHQWKVMKEWIVFSPGIVPALNLCVLAYTQPGDRVIIQPPVYHPFHTSVKGNGRELVFNPLREMNGNYRMDLEDLRRKVNDRTKMLILCNPHNPVSRAWTQSELEELASLALEKKLLILSDEIHSDLVMPGHRHIPLASLSPEVSRITITGMAPSKTFNMAGLSTSYLVIEDPSLREAFTRWTDTLHLWLGNVFGNIALEAAYRNGGPWLDQLLTYILENAAFTRQYLGEHLPGISMSPLEATYLGWLDFRKFGLPRGKVHEFLVHRAGVGFSEGAGFGPGGKGFERINLACPRQVLAEALDRIRNAAKHISHE